jgi:cephalosporin hydroxylase
MGMGELNNIGLQTGTDKNSNYHGYLDIYESYLRTYRSSPVTVIELGVGGYEYTDRGGESLRMWYRYFNNAKLIGIDIHAKDKIINDRTEFWQGSQTDKNLLVTILQREENAPQRFIIDDASHNNRLTVESFDIIFPQLKSGDLYFIEDVHTSYFEDEGYEGKAIPGDKGTTMDYFASLTHQLNSEHFAGQYRDQYAGMIDFIHFYKELIVIKRV